MEKNRIRGERRFHERRVQKKRINDLISTWWRDVVDSKSNHVGMLRHNHYGCGCTMCKPWKHNLENKYKVSERKQKAFYVEEEDDKT